MQGQSNAIEFYVGQEKGIAIIYLSVSRRGAGGRHGNANAHLDSPKGAQNHPMTASCTRPERGNHFLMK